MSAIRLFVALFRWDLLRELRRRETITNMLLFALLVIFVAHLGVGTDRRGAESVGPVIFWIAVLFAGTVGLAQTFAAERTDGAIGAIVTAPVDLGLFYLAKVAAVWIYVSATALAALALYGVLFAFSAWARLGNFAIAIAIFNLAYVGCGVVIAAMTSTLRGGGEVLLRILLFPLMIPLVWLTLNASQVLFDAPIGGGNLGPALKTAHYYAIGAAFDTIYVAAGYLLFPKVIEE